MNAIEQHINYLFQDLPETEEIKRIKNDLYLNAADRYDELISEGKAESEALGTIIIEMGDRDDLLDSFDYNQDQDLRDYSTNTLGEAKYLLDTYDIESGKIGLGVLLILLGAGFITTLSTFQMMEIGVVVLLMLVASAVGLFIHSGLKIESVEMSLHDEDKIFYLIDDDYEMVREQYVRFKEKERFRIPLGVMLCISSAVPILAISFLGNDFLVERYGVPLLMLMVGTGVYQFIKYGMKDTAFEKVLNIGEYSDNERKFQEQIEPMSSIYWMIVTIAYLLWSFLTGMWYISWIIWPIAGMLWGLISTIVKMKNDK